MLKRAVFLLVVLTLSCSVTPPADELETSLGERGETALEEVRKHAVGGRHKMVRKEGKRYLEDFHSAADAEEVRLLVGAADIELGFYDEATELLLPVIERPSSESVAATALLLLAEADRSKGRFLESAERVLQAFATDLDDDQRMRADAIFSDLLGLLSRGQLDRLESNYPSSPRAGLVLEANMVFASAASDTAAIRRIREKLAKLGTSTLPREIPAEAVTLSPSFRKDQDDGYRVRVGLLCPLTGRFSAVGEAFLHGAALALKEARTRGFIDVELVVGDTRASPLDAREVAERLITDEGVFALVGGVLSTSTIAAAQVSNFRETVLLSPVATEEGIAAIGEWIFQTTVNEQSEVVAAARLACGELGLSRIAVLAPDDARLREMERLFRTEVLRSGGEIVVSAFYPEGSTDFKEHILRIREADPEALYIASETDDLILILPQLSFYEFGVQLLGTSTWNSKRLLRMVGRDMEGAIFPAVVGSRIDEELYRAAAALTGERIGEINAFVLGGYQGVRTILEALREGGGGDATLRRELAKLLENRRHPYLELFFGSGIPFYRVTGERIEEYTTLRAIR